MSRYTGPRVKVMRAVGTTLPGLSAKNIERRPYPPGQHGHGRPRKLSEYGLRLLEKKKLCVNYGITERQMRRYVLFAKSMLGPTGNALIGLLERRLDNVVFRAGFARTIPAARQLVNHGHVRVNGRRVDIPSYSIRARDVVTLAPASQELPHVLQCLSQPREFQTAWLETDPAARSARVIDLPDSNSILFPIDVQLVVEFYSQKI